MLTQSTYIEYLLSTPRNYTCMHLADHLPGVSHDQVNRFLRNSSFGVRQLRTLVLPLLRADCTAVYMISPYRWLCKHIHKIYANE